MFGNDIKEVISMKNVECQSKLDTISGERYFVLQRTNRPILKGYRQIEMMASKEEAEKWVNAFSAIGIFRELNGSMSNLAQPMVEKMVRQKSMQLRQTSISSRPAGNYRQRIERVSISVRP